MIIPWLSLQKPNRKTIRYAIGGALIAFLFIAVLVKGIDSTVFFYTPQEVLAATNKFQGKVIRIGALITPQSTQWDQDALLLKFKITETGAEHIPVYFAGAKPDMYREGQGVVVEGQFDAKGIFLAETVLVKHSEEYQVDKSQYSKQSLYQTLETPR